MNDDVSSSIMHYQWQSKQVYTHVDSAKSQHSDLTASSFLKANAVIAYLTVM